MDSGGRKAGDKDVQKRAFSFACRIVKFYQFLAHQKGAGEVLAKQVLRSGTSIGANLEEAAAGQSKADFISKCNIALKEARETHYWLRLFTETELVPPEKLEALMNESNELVAILTTVVKNARASE
ncbi:MAG TPA: four helix bundle protein [Phycisphaerales bacterium]|nr:four helix bundle protein [Phycisphaerales bacterium]